VNESPFGIPVVNASTFKIINDGDIQKERKTSRTLHYFGINGIELGGKGYVKWISLSLQSAESSIVSAMSSSLAPISTNK